MKRCIIALVGLMLTQVSFGGEAANARLAELLQPSAGSPILRSLPAALAPLKDPAIPVLALAKFKGQPPRPELVAGKQVYPHSAQEPAPLTTYFASAELPQIAVMSETALVVIPTLVNVDAVPPVAILSPQPLGDRAPLADATLEASVAATLAKPLPLRRQQVPFTAMNLPDPFEFQQYIRVPNPPAETGPTILVPAQVLVLPVLEAKAPVKK